MAKSTIASSLSTVNDMLIEQLLSVTEDGIPESELNNRLKKAKAVANLSSKVVDVNKTVIDAIKVECEYGRGNVSMIGISTGKNG